MAITQQQLIEAARIIAGAPSPQAAASVLRERLSPLRTLVVDALDMQGERPALSIPALREGAADRPLYLMSTDGHCWSVTQDPGAAAALVLTRD